MSDLSQRLREFWMMRFALWGTGTQSEFESDKLHREAADRIEKLEEVLEKISKERTLWGAMRKADHALGKFDHQKLEGKDD